MKIKTSAEYFNFLKKFGWDRASFDKAFPQRSFDNCINNHSVETRKLKYKGRKGLVDAWLVHPKQQANTKKTPLVIYNRGGAAKWGKLIMADLLNFCQLAEQGYAVIASDFRGSKPKGVSNNESIPLDVTDLGYGDVYDSIDLITLASEIGTIDTSKVALWGFSRGTMINAMMLTKIKNIKAVIMSGTVSRKDDDFRRSEFDEHVYPLIVDNWNALTKAEQQKLLLGVSPLHLIDGILSKPAFLFLHGAKDKRTPANRMLNYVQALQDKGHTIELRLYSEGTHNLYKYQGTVLEEISNWLETNLKP
ncbi:prolyl oligopeptidase family serine peptidase [uncultured Pseudoteredinibacter sp.]|uniref:alpha/beta hydrolase family protein n=1 Tax=uncultured Pseudoteredinibacter sp. TaxID=1641701 RepID=UPI002630D2B2|nr:prolyl oligopeptidase family serine peptidase [uncultured Pseudoteredinibacter sp.]